MEAIQSSELEYTVQEYKSSVVVSQCQPLRIFGTINCSVSCHQLLRLRLIRNTVGED
jgi:hypothetical protein